MKRILISSLVILFASVALAEWALISTEELLKKTDLIVVARLTDVKETSKKGVDYGAGTLTVSEVIRGSTKTGQKLRLEWSNATGIVCPRIEHREHADKTLIWLLETSTNGAVRADYPLRVMDLKERGYLDKVLKK